MAQVVGKIFKTETTWSLRVSVDGGQAGKFERVGFNSAKEAAAALGDLAEQANLLYNSDIMKQLAGQAPAVAV